MFYRSRSTQSSRRTLPSSTWVTTRALRTWWTLRSCGWSRRRCERSRTCAPRRTTCWRCWSWAASRRAVPWWHSTSSQPDPTINSHRPVQRSSGARSPRRRPTPRRCLRRYVSIYRVSLMTFLIPDERFTFFTCDRSSIHKTTCIEIQHMLLIMVSSCGNCNTIWIGFWGRQTMLQLIQSLKNGQCLTVTKLYLSSLS